MSSGISSAGDAYVYPHDVYPHDVVKGVDEHTTPATIAAAGILPDYIYDQSLSWWRAAVRRILVANLEHESRWIAAMQVSSSHNLDCTPQSSQDCRRTASGRPGWMLISSIPRRSARTPSSSSSCRSSSSLDTMRWVGGAPYTLSNMHTTYQTLRSITMLAIGVYLSSFIKDLFCSPRPFAPPVTRLSTSISIL